MGLKKFLKKVGNVVTAPVRAVGRITGIDELASARSPVQALKATTGITAIENSMNKGADEAQRQAQAQADAAAASAKQVADALAEQLARQQAQAKAAQEALDAANRKAEINRQDQAAGLLAEGGSALAQKELAGQNSQQKLQDSAALVGTNIVAPGSGGTGGVFDQGASSAAAYAKTGATPGSGGRMNSMNSVNGAAITPNTGAPVQGPSTAASNTTFSMPDLSGIKFGGSK